MALLIHYIGTVTFRQTGPPAWSKSYAGETDTCTLQWRGAQYLEKAFLDSLTKYQSLQYIDEAGVTVTDSSMKLIKFSSDDAAIFPTVTLYFEGSRGGTAQDAIPTDDIVLQSATTNCVITDASSPNYGKSITMAIQYYAARTSWEWVQLTDPAGTPYASAPRVAKTYTGPYGDPDIPITQFSGMVDASGNPSKTISIGDATEVWNTFVLTNTVSAMNAKEVVPGHVWKCACTVDGLLIGT